MKNIMMAAVAAVTLGMTGVAMAGEPIVHHAVQVQTARNEQVSPQQRPAYLARNESVSPQQRPAYLARNESVSPQQRPAYLARNESVSPQQRPAYLA
jgi:CelD/BcsL family acetyltransferase involved in cellulose biosynthesis